MTHTLLQEYIYQRLGCPIHYWFNRVEGAPLVVFTHGLCVDHRSWDKSWPAVVDQYSVLTWDVRGHGKSQPAGEGFSIPLAVEDVLALVDRLGYEKAIFVGHSNGTYIAQELVFRHPERVQALVIADGTCITWEHNAYERWLLRISPMLMSLFSYEALKKTSLSYASRQKAVQEYTIQAYSMLTKNHYIALMDAAAKCLHYEPDYTITAPLLLVHGDEDKMGDIARIAPRWAKREPNCQYVVIPGARHFAILDNPEFFNKLLLQFLQRWAPVGGAER
ncbi:MAG: alpha/beta hydrolase [Chloroflexi bacterium]|nr:alpha/beta hydrolase [Chloroflexota bacterium]